MAKSGLLIIFSIVVVILAPSNAACDAVTLGVGAGAILHGDVGTDIASKSGTMGTVFLEYISAKNVGVRGEVSWIKFPNNSTGILYPAGSDYSYRSTPISDDIGLSGASLRLMWLKEHGKWIQTTASFVVGGFKVNQDEYSQIMVLLGPSIGGRFGNGRPSAGVELDMQLAVFEDKNMLMVPVKVYVMLKLY